MHVSKGRIREVERVKLDWLMELNFSQPVESYIKIYAKWLRINTASYASSCFDNAFPCCYAFHLYILNAPMEPGLLVSV